VVIPCRSSDGPKETSPLPGPRVLPTGTPSHVPVAAVDWTDGRIARKFIFSTYATRFHPHHGTPHSIDEWALNKRITSRELNKLHYLQPPLGRTILMHTICYVARGSGYRESARLRGEKRPEHCLQSQRSSAQAHGYRQQSWTRQRGLVFAFAFAQP
jgi:hypothetical protein